jgi:uncharacterized membrane protein YhaH (DUF805 family)
MSATSPSDHDDKSKSARPSSSGKSARKAPWQIVLAVAAWAVLGVLLVVSGVGGSSSDSAAQQSITQVQGELGDSAVSTSQDGGHQTILLLLGLVTLVLAALLLMKRAWARYVLALSAIAAMVVFSLDHQWQTTAAFAILVVGSVPLLAAPARDYLENR